MKKVLFDVKLDFNEKQSLKDVKINKGIIIHEFNLICLIDDSNTVYFYSIYENKLIKQIKLEDYSNKKIKSVNLILFSIASLIPSIFIAYSSPNSEGGIIIINIDDFESIISIDTLNEALSLFVLLKDKRKFGMSENVIYDDFVLVGCPMEKILVFDLNSALKNNFWTLNVSIRKLTNFTSFTDSENSVKSGKLSAYWINKLNCCASASVTHINYIYSRKLTLIGLSSGFVRIYPLFRVPTTKNNLSLNVGKDCSILNSQQFLNVCGDDFSKLNFWISFGDKNVATGITLLQVDCSNLLNTKEILTIDSTYFKGTLRSLQIGSISDYVCSGKYNLTDLSNLNVFCSTAVEGNCLVGTVFVFDCNKIKSTYSREDIFDSCCRSVEFFRREKFSPDSDLLSVYASFPLNSHDKFLSTFSLKTLTLCGYWSMLVTGEQFMKIYKILDNRESNQNTNFLSNSIESILDAFLVGDHHPSVLDRISERFNEVPGRVLTWASTKIQNGLSILCDLDNKISVKCQKRLLLDLVEYRRNLYSIQNIFEYLGKNGLIDNAQVQVSQCESLDRLLQFFHNFHSNDFIFDHFGSVNYRRLISSLKETIDERNAGNRSPPLIELLVDRYGCFDTNYSPIDIIKILSLPRMSSPFDTFAAVLASYTLLDLIKLAGFSELISSDFDIVVVLLDRMCLTLHSHRISFISLIMWIIDNKSFDEASNLLKIVMTNLVEHPFQSGDKWLCGVILQRMIVLGFYELAYDFLTSLNILSDDLVVLKLFVYIRLEMWNRAVKIVLSEDKSPLLLHFALKMAESEKFARTLAQFPISAEFKDKVFDVDCGNSPMFEKYVSLYLEKQCLIFTESHSNDLTTCIKNSLIRKLQDAGNVPEDPLKSSLEAFSLKPEMTDEACVDFFADGIRYEIDSLWTRDCVKQGEQIKFSLNSLWEVFGSYKFEEKAERYVHFDCNPIIHEIFDDSVCQSDQTQLSCNTSIEMVNYSYPNEQVCDVQMVTSPADNYNLINLTESIPQIEPMAGIQSEIGEDMLISPIVKAGDMTGSVASQDISYVATHCRTKDKSALLKQDQFPSTALKEDMSEVSKGDQSPRANIGEQTHTLGSDNLLSAFSLRAGITNPIYFPDDNCRNIIESKLMDSSRSVGESAQGSPDRAMSTSADKPFTRLPILSGPSISRKSEDFENILSVISNVGTPMDLSSAELPESSKNEYLLRESVPGLSGSDVQLTPKLPLFGTRDDIIETETSVTYEPLNISIPATVPQSAYEPPLESSVFFEVNPIEENTSQFSGQRETREVEKHSLPTSLFTESNISPGIDIFPLAGSTDHMKSSYALPSNESSKLPPVEITDKITECLDDQSKVNDSNYSLIEAANYSDPGKSTNADVFKTPNVPQFARKKCSFIKDDSSFTPRPKQISFTESLFQQNKETVDESKYSFAEPTTMVNYSNPGENANMPPIPQFSNERFSFVKPDSVFTSEPKRLISESIRELPDFDVNKPKVVGNDDESQNLMQTHSRQEYSSDVMGFVAPLSLSSEKPPFGGSESSEKIAPFSMLPESEKLPFGGSEPSEKISHRFQIESFKHSFAPPSIIVPTPSDITLNICEPSAVSFEFTRPDILFQSTCQNEQSIIVESKSVMESSAEALPSVIAKTGLPHIGGSQTDLVMESSVFTDALPSVIDIGQTPLSQSVGTSFITPSFLQTELPGRISVIQDGNLGVGNSPSMLHNQSNTETLPETPYYYAKSVEEEIVRDISADASVNQTENEEFTEETEKQYEIVSDKGNSSEVAIFDTTQCELNDTEDDSVNVVAETASVDGSANVKEIFDEFGTDLVEPNQMCWDEITSSESDSIEAQCNAEIDFLSEDIIRGDISIGENMSESSLVGGEEFESVVKEELEPSEVVIHSLTASDHSHGTPTGEIRVVEYHDMTVDNVPTVEGSLLVAEEKPESPGNIRDRVESPQTRGSISPKDVLVEDNCIKPVVEDEKLVESKKPAGRKKPVTKTVKVRKNRKKIDKTAKSESEKMSPLDQEVESERSKRRRVRSVMKKHDSKVPEDSEPINDISNKELKKFMKENGIECGPINKWTRTTYLNQYYSIMEDKSKNVEAPKNEEDEETVPVRRGKRKRDKKVSFEKEEALIKPHKRRLVETKEPFDSNLKLRSGRSIEKN